MGPAAGLGPAACAENTVSGLTVFFAVAVVVVAAGGAVAVRVASAADGRAGGRAAPAAVIPYAGTVRPQPPAP